MALCPRCRSEYEGDVTRCADCDVDLVGVVASSPDDGPDPEVEAAAVALHCAGPEARDVTAKVLEARGLPYREETLVEGAAPALVVPLELAQAALRALSAVPRLVLERRDEGIGVRLYDPETDEEIRDPAIVKRSLKDLKRNADEAIPELVRVALRGDARARGSAAFLLAQMDEGGREGLRAALLSALEEDRSAALGPIVEGLLRVGPGPAEERLRPLLRHASETIRAAAASVVGRLGWKELADGLIALLSDPMPFVQEEADNALCELYDDDLGFDVDAPDEVKEEIIRRWRERVQ